MKFFVLAAALAASPASAMTYSECISNLSDMLKASDAIYAGRSLEADASRALNDGGDKSAAVASQIATNFKADTDADKAMKAYLAAMADTCQAMR